MTNRFPIIIDTLDGNKLKELPAGDNLDLDGSGIVNVASIQTAGNLSAMTLTVNGESLSAVAFSNNYQDLDNVPVLFSGDYNDLVGKPNIPGKIEQLDNVDMLPPSDGDALVYNASLESYVPQPVLTEIDLSTKTLNDLGDTVITGVITDRYLKFTAGAWRASTINWTDVKNKPTGVSAFTNDAGYITLADITGEITVNPAGDLKGSVFADDSTLLVDGVNGVIPGTLTGMWNNPGNIFNVIGEGIQLGATSTAFGVTSGGLTFANSVDNTSISLAMTSGNINLGATGGISVASVGSFTASTGDLAWAINGTVTVASKDVSWSMDGIATIASNGLAWSTGSATLASTDLAWSISGTAILAADNIVIDSNGVTADLRGSVFGDDSTLLVDGVDGKIVGNVETARLRTSETTIALGGGAGETTQGVRAVAIGDEAGRTNQGVRAVAIGYQAGENTQGLAAVAIGDEAGRTNQGIRAVAIGELAGQTNQGIRAVAIGELAGQTTQGVRAVAIGDEAGETTQGNRAVAIGGRAGQTAQGVLSVAIGYLAGSNTQSFSAVAIGAYAGETAQGSGAIAIGDLAGQTAQGNNSIVINATGVALNNTVANTFVVKPVRAATGTSILQYDATTGEITHTNEISSDQQISITVSGEDSTEKTWYFGNDGDLTLPDFGAIEGENSEISVAGFYGSVFSNRPDQTGLPGVQIATTGGDYNQISLVCNGTNSGVGLFGRRAIELSAIGGFIDAIGILKIDDGVQEKFQTKANATSVVEHDLQSGQIIYHTSPNANWTVNLTNLDLSTTYATSVTLVIVQGATPYGPNALQIGGVAQTILWQGGTAPSGTANGVDVVTFSILNNSGTYTVLGQLTDFAVAA